MTVRATAAERLQSMPGDDLIVDPLASLTHAITIDRPARDVWPWLAQMGAGSRAGWYSYDLLDNGRQRSAERIVPELQALTPGMIFPALPGVTAGFTLIAFEPKHHLVLGWQENGRLRVTWAFGLNDRVGGSCRLVVRARESSAFHVRPWSRWIRLLTGRAMHFVMQRKQLLGIKRRAESRTTGRWRDLEHDAA